MFTHIYTNKYIRVHTSPDFRILQLGIRGLVVTCMSVFDIVANKNGDRFVCSRQPEDGNHNIVDDLGGRVKLDSHYYSNTLDAPRIYITTFHHFLRGTIKVNTSRIYEYTQKPI